MQIDTRGWLDYGWALCVSLLFLLWNGYVVNGGDQAEHLPQVYKALNPDLYPHDYFVQANENTYTVRYFYVQVVSNIARILGVETTCFLLTVVCVSLSAWAFSRITRHLGGNSLAAWLSPVLILGPFYNYYSLGTNLIQENLLLSGSFGLAFTALALLQFVSKRYRWAFFVLGIAGLFHVMFAFVMFTLLASYFVMYERRQHSLMYGLQAFALYFISTSPMLLPMIYKQVIGDGYVYDTQLYNQVQYVFRNYHHFLPSSFRHTHYIKFIGLNTAGFALTWWMPALPIRRWIRFFYIAVILGFVGYYIGFELLGIGLIGKTQWPKGTTMWVTVFSCIGFGIWMGGFLQQFLKYTVRTILKASLLAVLFLIATWALLNSAQIPFLNIPGKYQVGNYTPTHLQKMHFWIAQHTPVDAVFLTDPTDDAFAGEAKRSLITGYRAIIHEPWFMMPWFQNFCTIYGVTLQDGLTQNVYDILSDRYHTVDFKQNPAHTTYNIQYRLLQKSKCTYWSDAWPIIHQEGDWVLTPF